MSEWQPIDNQKDQIIWLLDYFADTGLPDSEGVESLKITQETKQAALYLLDRIPFCARLPVICPDEDGTLVCVLDNKEISHIFVIDGWKLSLVKNAGTGKAEYYSDIDILEAA